VPPAQRVVNFFHSGTLRPLRLCVKILLFPLRSVLLSALYEKHVNKKIGDFYVSECFKLFQIVAHSGLLAEPATAPVKPGV
jgi:hypothetical protein